MHTVTKVLVVFAAVLCVLLAALTMAFSVNADRIATNYRDQVNAKLAAEESARVQLAAGKAEQDSLNEKIAALQAQLTNIGTQLQQRDQELAQLRLDLNKAQLAGDTKNAQIDQIAASNKTLTLLVGSYRDEVTKLRDNELSYRKREIELVDRINDLESSGEVKDQNLRALQEQLSELRRTVDTQGTTPTMQGPTGGPFRPSIPISGKVLKTTTGPNAKTYATINVGTNNQVKENMELAISRGGQFLGNIVVTKTDLQWSIGEVNTLGRKVEIREGDSVSTLVSR